MVVLGSQSSYCWEWHLLSLSRGTLMRRHRHNGDRRPRPGIEARGVNNLCYWCQKPVAVESTNNHKRKYTWTKNQQDGMCDECIEVSKMHADAERYIEAEKASLQWIQRNAHIFRTQEARRPSGLGKKLLELFGTIEDEEYEDEV